MTESVGYFLERECLSSRACSPDYGEVYELSNVPSRIGDKPGGSLCVRRPPEWACQMEQHRAQTKRGWKSATAPFEDTLRWPGPFLSATEEHQLGATCSRPDEPCQHANLYLRGTVVRLRWHAAQYR